MKFLFFDLLWEYMGSICRYIGFNLKNFILRNILEVYWYCYFVSKIFVDLVWVLIDSCGNDIVCWDGFYVFLYCNLDWYKNI